MYVGNEEQTEIQNKLAKKQYSDLYFKDSQTEEKINRVIRHHDNHRYAALALPDSVLFHEINK